MFALGDTDPSCGPVPTHAFLFGACTFWGIGCISPFWFVSRARDCYEQTKMSPAAVKLASALNLLYHEVV